MDQNFTETDGAVGNESHYRLIVPENSTPTYIHVHAMGAATDFTHENVYYILDGDRNKDTAYLLLDDADGEVAYNAGKGYSKLIEELSKKYNIPASNISVAGFSRGSNVASTTFASLVEDGYDVPFYVHMSGNSTNLTVDSYNRIAEVYKNSDNPPPFIFINDGENDAGPSLYNANKSWPGDVVELYYPEGGHRCDYQYIKNDLVGFLNGTSSLGDYDLYKFIRVFTLNADGETRTEKTFATQEEFEAYIKEYKDKFGTDLSSLSSTFAPISYGAQEIGSELVQSDRQELLTYINDIRKNLTLEVSVPSYDSTTLIPNSESAAIQQFFEATQRLFQVIEADTEFILCAAISLEDLDKLLSEKAGGLGGSSELGNIITGVTTAIGGFIGLLAMGPAGAVSGALIGNKIGSLIGQFFGLDTSSSKSTAETTASETGTASAAEATQTIPRIRTPLDPLDPSTFSNPPIPPYVDKGPKEPEIDTTPPLLMPLDPLDPLN